jgi:DNA-binding SARP family transcriptional activator
MRFRVLGPVRVRTGAGWVSVEAEQQRVVLAVLLADAGRVVSVDRLADAVWGERPPRRAVNTVQAYVLRLRRLLGSGVVVTRGHGYELVAGRDDIDAGVFERLVFSGRQELERGRHETGAARLAKALALWRGPVFADVPANPQLEARVAYFEQLRLTAEEHAAAALLECGQHEVVASRLHRLVEEQPLRERRWALLMTALHRGGRRAEALEAFHRARRVLHDELGLEPGLELRNIQAAVLAGELPPEDEAQPESVPVGTPRPTPPAQLLTDVSGFTGRDSQLKQLDAVLTAGEDPAAHAVSITAIAGPAGVGKTALAVHWGHTVRHRFGDGQLYVDLRGHAAASPIRPIEVLARFLRALGVPSEEIPSDVDEASALYRSRLAGRRVLVLLDNARDADQVRPLLPGDRGCLVVVTSRQRLASLVARDGAFALRLEVLTDAEARGLLTTLLDAGRVQAELPAATELATLCGNLPLALRIAAAHVAARPSARIEEYVLRLRRAPLASLEIAGEPDAGVRATFDLSYAAQPDRARQLFRLLALVPGPDFTGSAAAALTDLDPIDACAALDQLAAAHLVDLHLPGRYRLHDLLRHYAAERMAEEEPGAGRQAARHRLYGHYLDHANAAADLLYPHLLRLTHGTPGATDSFRDDTAASGWLEAEHANLTAAVLDAAHGLPEVAWTLADVLRGHFIMSMRTVDWHTVARTALEAAEREDHRPAQAAAHLNLGGLRWIQRRLADAVSHFTHAERLAGQGGWVEGRAAAVGNLGNAHHSQGQFREALTRYQQALAMAQAARQHSAEATVLLNLAVAHAPLGNLSEALDCLDDALTAHRRIGSRSGEGNVLALMGETNHFLGHLHRAAAFLSQAITIHEDTADRKGEAEARRMLAAVHRDLGRYRESHALAEAVLAFARDRGDLRLETQALNELAEVHLHRDQLDDARAAYREALTLAHHAGQRHIEAEILVGLGEAHRRCHDFDSAEACVQRAVDIARQLGYRLVEADAYLVQAATHLERGQPDQASDRASQALAIDEETGRLLGQARAHLLLERALERLGDGAAAANHHRRAGRLLTSATTHSSVVVSAVAG